MKKILLLFGIIILGIVLRIYLLNNFPIQLSPDEVTQIYDAISIAQTGKDIYGNSFPIMFVSVNDYKPPFYTYVTSLIYVILRNKEIIIRIPGVIFGILLIPAIFFFTLKLFNNRKIALFSALISAISPFEIFFSRRSFENIPGIFFMIVGFALLIIYTQKRENVRWIYFGLLSLILAMYIYFSHAIIIPILLSVFLLIYKNIFLISVRKIVIPMIFALILLLPLMIIILTNPESRYRSQNVFIGQDINLGKQIDFIKSDNQLLTQLLSLKSTADFSFNRYLKQFDPSYLFGNGLDMTNQGPLGMGILYSVQLLFLILGIIYLIKNNNKLRKENLFILSWILIGMIPSGITFEENSPHRSIMVFTMFDILTAVGIFYLLVFVDLKILKYKYIAYILIICLFFFQLIYFLNIYFVNYPDEKSQFIQYPFKEVAKFAWLNYNNYDKIIFDPVFGQHAPVIGTGVHYYFGYYGNYSPLKMQQEYKIGQKPREVIFDKFSIRKVEWNEDKLLTNTLLIVSQWSVDPKIIKANEDKIIKTFYFYDHTPAFYAISIP